MPEPLSSRSVVIVGGGLSGTLVAAHLLRRAPEGTHLVLVERHPPAGRGVAYGTECPDHLLNVPAARMGAWPDDPEHFLRWLRERVGRPGYPEQVEPGDFVPRHIYGDYIGEIFAQARYGAAPGVRFESVAGEAVDIEELSGGGGRVVLADGRSFAAQRVVLALGHLPGEYPIRRSLPFYRSRRYVHVPWQGEVLAGIGRESDVLIVGQGLTAIDIIVQLDRLGHTGTVHALSRRGLRPQAHRPAPASPPLFAPDALPATVRDAFHRVRAEVRAAAARGVDWRSVIDALRPQTQAIWQGFSWEERSRFMRHARPYWEVHRHRIAPRIAGLVERRVQEGRLHFHAGRLQTFLETSQGVEAVFHRRGSGGPVTLRVSKVINCTGPRTDYSKYQHPLLINLLARGLIDHDPLALGLNALPTGEVLRYRAGPTGWLYTLGAPLKGALWECTAVPEIRVQAQSLAERLLA